VPIFGRIMSTLQPSAEWIARRPRESPRDSSSSSSSSSGAGCCSGNKIISPLTREAAGLDDEHDRHEEVVGHRGSGGLIRGRAVFCLPPGVHWFQGHFAYTAVGGCSASLGVLGTELPVDPVGITACRKRYPVCGSCGWRASSTEGGAR